MASIDEDMPIWDSKVLERIGINVSKKRGQKKLEETIELYDDIVKWYRDLKNNKESYNEYIASFDSRFPDYSSISDIKKKPGGALVADMVVGHQKKVYAGILCS